MILKLKRWIPEFVDEEDILFTLKETDIMPKGYYTENFIRLDKIDGYSVEDDELVLIIGGYSYFFDLDETQLLIIENYFNILNTSIN